VLDCTNLAKHLRECLESNPELEYDIHLGSDDGTLQRIFFALNDGKQQIWSHCKGAVLMYDTKHGTNWYGLLQLGNFVTVDENGKTHVLTGSFVLNEEDVDRFSWAFQRFGLGLGLLGT